MNKIEFLKSESDEVYLKHEEYRKSSNLEREKKRMNKKSCHF
jgi:hypothetical protein